MQITAAIGSLITHVLVRLFPKEAAVVVPVEKVLVNCMRERWLYL